MSGTDKLVVFDVNNGVCVAAVRRRGIFGGFCREDIIIFVDAKDGAVPGY